VTTLIIGCGYLGGRVGGMLKRAGERVLGTVRSEARAAQIASLGIEPIIADVLSPGSLRGLPTADRVFYCVGFDRAAGASMRAVYADGLTNVLNNLPPGETRVVYASSTGVYGQTEGEWVDEATPPAPRTESGRLCLEAEGRLVDWAKRGGRQEVAVRLRFAGLYGPSRVVRRRLIEEGEPIPGDPEKLLNLVHVDDAASLAVAALSVAAPHPVYVVSDDRPVTRLEYYSLVASLLGAPTPAFVAAESGSVDEGRDATSKRVMNRRMKESLGVALAYPDITTGLPAALGV
jgi:nucleoside-diphosphate-sugar epimerase